MPSRLEQRTANQRVLLAAQPNSVIIEWDSLSPALRVELLGRCACGTRYGYRTTAILTGGDVHAAWEIICPGCETRPTAARLSDALRS
jgi:hypothetical protein